MPRKKKTKRTREELDAEHWGGWSDVAEDYIQEVQAATGSTSDKPIATYRHDANRPNQPIYAEDVAMALFVVDEVGEYGASYDQLQRCFKYWKRSYSRGKVSASLKLLQSKNIIIKIGGHQAGKHGARYRRRYDNDTEYVPIKDRPPQDKFVNDNPPTADDILANETNDDINIDGIDFTGGNDKDS